MTYDLFPSQLEVSPPLSDEQLLAIPAKRGVLALAGEGDAPILLLTAADIRGRLRTRLAQQEPGKRTKAADLRQITRKVLWKLTPSPFEADLAFLELAGRIYPDAYADMLAWKKGHFVYVDPAEQFPRFVRTTDVFAQRGLYIGPFAAGKWAQKFIDIIGDAFDLCRDWSYFRKSPNTEGCPYFQMGRCVGPCNGTVGMDQYRRIIERAAAFAAGDRHPYKDELAARMRQAAADLAFEKAASLKARLARLSELDQAPYANATWMQDMRWLMFQPSDKAKRAEVFLVSVAQVVKSEPVVLPLTEPAVANLLSQMSGMVEKGRMAAAVCTDLRSASICHHAPRDAGDAASGMTAATVPVSELDRWRIGLVISYLFAGESKRGLMIRWRPELTPKDMLVALEQWKV